MNEIIGTKHPAFSSSNQTIQSLRLWSYLTSGEGWGRVAGTAVRIKLQAHIARHPEVGLWRVEMNNIRRMDVTFSGEALVELIRHCQPTFQICLTYLNNNEVLENIAAAAQRRQVAVTLWTGTSVQVVGPEPRGASGDALDYACARPNGVRAADYAAATGLPISNASSQFEKLWEQGFLLRDRVDARSGGREFIYRPIG